MVIKGILLRLSQILLAAVGVYFLLISGTFLMKGELLSARTYLFYALGWWFFWAISSILVWRSPIELVREVAIVVYPLGAILSIGLSVFFGFRMRAMVIEQGLPEQREIWTFILAGVLIAIVMVVRCFDIQWLRSVEELKPAQARPDLDEEYGQLH